MCCWEEWKWIRNFVGLQWLGVRLEASFNTANSKWLDIFQKGRSAVCRVARHVLTRDNRVRSHTSHSRRLNNCSIGFDLNLMVLLPFEIIVNCFNCGWVKKKCFVVFFWKSSLRGKPLRKIPSFELVSLTVCIFKSFPFQSISLWVGLFAFHLLKAFQLNICSQGF